MYLERNASAQSSPLGIYNPCSPACEGGAIFVSSLQRFPPLSARLQRMLQRFVQYCNDCCKALLQPFSTFQFLPTFANVKRQVAQ